MAGWTFATPTDGVTNPHFHREIIDSIRALKIPEYEILIATEQPGDHYAGEPDVREIYVEPLKPMWITRKKNECVRAAKYPHICIFHDYIKFDPGWYEGYERFGFDWDVCSNPIYKEASEHRHRDWIVHEGWTHIPYEVTDRTREQYVSGTYWCAKTAFMLQYPLNEDLIWNQNEDGEWSFRIRDFWNLKLNPYSVVRTMKPPR